MRSERRRVAGCAIVCGALLAAGLAHAAGETDPSVASDAPGWWRGGDGLRLPGIGAEWHIYRKDGLRVDRSDGLMQMRFNANFWIDSGDLRANAPVEAAFPSYAGTNSEFTRARFTARGRFLDAGDFKFQLDLAQKAQVKDAWLRFDPLPVLGRIRIGNMREPLSIENQTHGGNLTFMSRALPVLAFAPGRNIGVVASNDAFDGRLNWALGWFWNTTS